MDPSAAHSTNPNIDHEGEHVLQPSTNPSRNPNNPTTRKPTKNGSRMLRELRGLMPWAWDARIEDNPVGSRGLSDFGEAVTLLDPTVAAKRPQQTGRNKHERSVKKSKHAGEGQDDDGYETQHRFEPAISVPSCCIRWWLGYKLKLSPYYHHVARIGLARKTWHQVRTATPQPRSHSVCSNPRRLALRRTPTPHTPTPPRLWTSHGMLSVCGQGRLCCVGHTSLVHTAT